MKDLYCVRIDNSLSLEEAWEAFEQAGIEMAYGSDEEGHVDLYLYLSSGQSLPPYSWIQTIQSLALPAIDWDAQWAAHGQDFRDGFVHVSFEHYSRQAKSIRLQPGPGFGDLSHPTTRLVLELMARLLKDQPVIDIGCGSGILSLAAAAMGAPAVHGIDIDPAAIEHSKQNALLNHLENQCHFSLPEGFSIPSHQDLLIVMNMILSEQQDAWASLPSLHAAQGICLTSGIRIEEHQTYLELAARWGWELKEEIEKDGWLGFCFSLKGLHLREE
ncbi:50S ribosomal protein L11 methyltransferase [Candidatus Protochlamydia phocaeensis]|uniref:50S ribosomal protein L11 methyltransferase n=1 Tax=Candidatus Protochlamydia phocaeensis TaxID=1414722 RepID=UPI0008382965|nr:50S ribosomal protein L11 methyltransferase [Candidatus Protochlamydia phocaeensis]